MLIAAVALARFVVLLTALSISSAWVSFALVASVRAAERTAQGDGGAAELAHRGIERRAVEAAIWGMPVVAFDAMRQAFLRDAGAHYNDTVYWSRQARENDGSGAYKLSLKDAAVDGFWSIRRSRAGARELVDADLRALSGDLLR